MKKCHKLQVFFDAAEGNGVNQSTRVCRSCLNLQFRKGVFSKVEVMLEEDTM